VTGIKRILAVTDPTSVAQPALLRAGQVARRVGADLELLVCYHDEYLSGDRLIDAPSLQSAREQVSSVHEDKLEQYAAPLRESGLGVSTAVIWDHPLFEGIVRHVLEGGFDLVFKDTHHHAALDRALFSNTDWNLIRTCPAPLWLVKPPGDTPVDTVLAAIDPLHQHDKPAALDDEILRLAGDIAGKLDADLHVFHSYDPRTAEATAIGNAYIPPSLPYVEIETTIRTLHEKRVGEVTGYHGIPPEKCHLLPGLAHKQLPELAEKLPAQLVVMGAVARRGVKRLFIGATAERTLEHLPCDLLVVKPDWFESPVAVEADS
jgi:universal stress protein E